VNGGSRPASSGRRLLAVHAHPDDETITTGVTLAACVAAGAQVVLVTCTRGEQGEVIPPELAHLQGAALGAHREGELAAAMAALGVTDHRFLGAAQGVRYLDSGMAIDPEGRVVLPQRVAPDAFALAGVEDAAPMLAEVIDELRPHVVLTYDPNGGYGHPDHVQTHRVTMRAVQLAAWSVPKLYWIVVPRAAVAAQLAELARPDNPFAPWPDGALLRTAIEDGAVTAAIGGVPELTAAKAAALRAHATQISVREPYFALSHGLGQVIAAREYFHLARGSAGPASQRDAAGHELDLFAGLD